MNRLHLPLLRRLAALLLLAGAAAVCAADAEAPPPPARVGQLSFMTGSVRMWVDAGAAWLPAELNTPIVAHGALATEAASRVELRIGSAALRAGVSTEFSLAELDDSAVTAELARGSLALRVRTLAAGERYSMGAEGVRFSALMPGAYRADFAPRQHRLTVHVFEGQARVNVGQQEVLLGAGQRALVDTQQLTVLEQGLGEDRKRLDDFSDQRDRRSERSVALRHLPPEMTGAESLDGHGAWRSEAGYGMVWYPDNLAPDWAPYRFGHWRWIAPWGWTWIDDAPWGFAPFHYGRWLFLGGRWAWVPASPAGRAAGWRPVYAPALVGFYGGAAGDWSPAAAASPVVGWYPLAPGEVYWPAYSSHIGYVRGLNAASVADPAQIRAVPDPGAAGPAHRFARTAFAATAVPLASFHQMQPVGQNQVPMAPAALAQAPLSGRRAPPALVAPTEEAGAPPRSAAAGRAAERGETETAERAVGSEKPAKAGAGPAARRGQGKFKPAHAPTPARQHHGADKR